MEYNDDRPGMNPRISLYSILVTAFIVITAIKLFGHISWSWWWVTLPLWIVPVFYVLMFLITLLLAIFRTIKQGINNRKSWKH